MNCTPFVRQYGILNNKWGDFIIPKGIPNKKYTPEFKKLVVETVQKEKLGFYNWHHSPGYSFHGRKGRSIFFDT